MTLRRTRDKAFVGGKKKENFDDPFCPETALLGLSGHLRPDFYTLAPGRRRRASVSNSIPIPMNVLPSRFRRRTRVLGALLFAASSAASMLAGPVDLTSWSVQNYSAGAGNWVIQPGGTTVLQTVNGNPTVFLSNESALGTQIQGKVKVTTTGDNDFFGFVLGFSAGDFSNAAADYLLVDWKQANQDIAKVGLAVSRVNGVASAADPNFWGHTGNVTELARGATLGSTGWADNVEYTFDFSFTTTNLQVSVNGVQQINLNGNFSGGNLGFYNYSQSSVLYSGFTQDVLPPPPPTGNGVPDAGASVLLLGLSLGALGVVRRRLLR
jgi:hypothetical protein